MEINKAAETDDMDATIQRVGTNLVSEITTSTRLRRRWIRGGSAAGAAVVLFAAGILVGGAASPIPQPNTDILTVQCFTSVDAKAPWLESGYQSVKDAARARADAGGVCEQQQKIFTPLNALDKIVTGLHSKGVDCGTLSASDGTTWNFEYNPISKRNPDGRAYGISDGTPVVPLGPQCITQTVSLPTYTPQPVAVCTVNSATLNVYPLGDQTATALCTAKGLTPVG
jgi:hypothetical protein